MIVHDVWQLTPYRLAIHRPTNIAVLADLHLGYHQTRRCSGDAIPAPTITDGLHVLAEAGERYRFHEVILAGDVLERAWSDAWLSEIAGWLDRHELSIRAIVPGNHDRRLPASLGPVVDGSFELDGWRIIHGDGELGQGKVVMGHWHPSVRRHGRKVPCFLVGQRQLILPAFSAEAAGVDMARDARWRGWQAWAIVNGGVFRVTGDE